MRTSSLLAIGAVTLLAVGGCTTTSAPDAAPPPASLPPALPSAGLIPTATTIERWVDGDTVVTAAGRVRILGIDTPERGQCGFGPATSRANRIAPPGSPVSLLAAPGDEDTDRYGRLLRYVQAGDVDVGYELIREGLAIARYDSRDGYGAHPREDAYIAADAATPDRCP